MSASVVMVGAAALASAGAAGFAAWAYTKRCTEENRVRQLRALSGGADVPCEFLVTGVYASVLAYVVRVGEGMTGGSASRGRRRRKASSATSPSALHAASERFAEKTQTELTQAGLGWLSSGALSRAAGRLCVMFAVVGAVVGAAVSGQMAVFLGAAAGVIGALAPRWAVRQERTARTEALSRELPELLEVCALGLRSGLTFDRSFRLYPKYAQTPFARECEAAMNKVDVGLATRKEALAELSASYDSPLFARTMANVEQSIIRGTSLTDDLERAAAEARKAYQARKEAIVAKAPVKMMLPIGVLILPAMLLLILGPVVLGLVQGI